MKKHIDPLSSSRLLGQACFGVIIGVLVALLVAGLTLQIGGRPEKIPEEMLSWNLHNVWMKPREKGFYLLSILFGFLGAYITTIRLWRINLFILYSLLILSVPFVNLLIVSVLQNDYRFLWVINTIVALSLFGLFLTFKGEKISPALREFPVYQFRKKTYLFCLLILTLLLLPRSFVQVATHIGMQFHVVSFMIGPAIYFLNHNLLPGIDYFTQYSIGMGWLFSFLLGNSADDAMLNYAYFVIFAIWIFYAQILYLLQWLYRSWVATILVTFTSLILLFVTNIHFFAPSSSVLRYPLLGVCAWLLAKWIEKNTLRWQLALSLGIALSLFLNTETGIIISLAAAAGFWFSSLQKRKAFIELLSLGLTSLFTLILILFAVFGQAIFQQKFVLYLIEPLIIYGKIGFGGAPILWNFYDLNWFYNLIAPGVAIATLGLTLRSAKLSKLDPSRIAVLAFFSLAGLLMLAKYINMSLIAVWQMNALGLLIPFGWWTNVIAERINSRYLRLNHTNASRFRLNSFKMATFATWTLASFAAIWLAGFSNDMRNPSEYGIRSWLRYPALIHPRSTGCREFACVPNRPSEKDVALITQRTKPGEQVAILDMYDWTYLISAHRPPLIFFLPSLDVFTKRQLNESLTRISQAPYLFLPKGENKEPVIDHDDFKNALLPTFYDTYEWDGEGERLVAWKRKATITS